jgi:VanZ family protein
MSLDAQNSERPALFQHYFPLPLLAATIVYCAFIYWLSSMTGFPVESPFPNFDKSAHFLLYAGLAAVIATGLLKARHAYSAVILFIVPAGFCLLYGLSDEVHQLFVEGRNFDVGDIIADTLGAAAAALLMIAIYKGRADKGRG